MTVLHLEGGAADGHVLECPVIPATLEALNHRTGVRGSYRFCWALANGGAAVFIPATPTQVKELPPC